MNTVQFEVVQIYNNHCSYAPYTLKPIDEDSVVMYAVKIGNDYYLLGEKGCGVYLCDYEEEKQ